MKTSNKTNRRFLGVAVVIMVLNLVTVNLAAQKSFNENSLSELGSKIFMNTKYEILHAIYDSKTNNNTVSEESIENWMINPKEWIRNESSLKEVNFEEDELILETWMLKANWKNNSQTVVTESNFEEKEMILEDWMMKANWEDNSTVEEALQIEDWMNNPKTWNSKKNFTCLNK